MTSTAEAQPLEAAPAGGASRALWGRQLAAILRLEIRKSFLGKRAVLIYLLALMPVLLTFALAFTPFTARGLADPGRANNTFAWIYAIVVQQTAVFFGCAWIFMNLFRGEVVDRSLHYYFLAAVRREVLVAGKYLSGLLSSAVLFGVATILSFLLLHVPRGVSATLRDVTEGSDVRYALTYVSITVLACLGYGAVFLVIGLFFRNPILPTLALYGWEWINFLLPPILKKLSVVHYLNSLAPVPLNEGPFAIPAEATPAWIAVPGLILTTAVLLAIAGLQIRRMEIKYGGD